MRIRFMSYLGIGVVSGFLIAASYAFVADTFWWIAMIGGIVLAVLAFAEIAMTRGRVELAVPAGLVTLLGIVMAVIAVAATATAAANWGFGLAIATAGLAVIGLLGHEAAAERDLHRRDRGRPPAPAMS